MKLSIITPHYQNFEGLKTIYECLVKQSSDKWEWIIVDDFSDSDIRSSINAFFESLSHKNIHLIFNTIKTNASVCRNLGAKHAAGDHLVFLDADDIISPEFVANRSVEVSDFIVYKNFCVLNEEGKSSHSADVSNNFLDHFLKAHFIWQTSCVLWNKSFFTFIGGFDEALEALQDIEVFLRALYKSTAYEVKDNPLDFYYCVTKINTKKRPVSRRCASVNYLIERLNNDYKLTKSQRSLVKGYYYNCIVYLHRSKNRSHSKYVRQTLKLFKTNGFIGYRHFLIGMVLLALYQYRLMSPVLFLDSNRYFFKS